MKHAAMFALALAGSALAACSTPALAAPVPADSGSAVVNSDGVTLPDLIYYGTCWWQLQETPFVDPPVALGNGYRNATVAYDTDGNYFAGTVEKVDAQGQVTDVILAFAAAKTGAGLNALQDITDNSQMASGGGSVQATRAAGIYADLMANPAYMNARIHVAGLSLGSAFTQYILGYSIATYGKAATAARVDFTQFGVPGYSQGIATHFGLSIADFDGMITGYTPKNDPTPIALPTSTLLQPQPQLGTQLMGIMHWMADYRPYGPLPVFAVLNGLAAHESWAYLGAFGWPAWISAADKQNAIATIGRTEPPTAKVDPNYGASGSVAQTIIGDGAANALVGTASDDALQGRGGADVLTGGGGRNSFLYSAVGDSTPANPDLITDFGANDKIDLTGMGRPAGFAFVGAQSPAQAGKVGYRIVGGETLVEINTSGGASPDMVIRLAGAHNLTASNFALGGALTDAAAYLLYQAFNSTGDPFVSHVVLGF